LRANPERANPERAKTELRGEHHQAPESNAAPAGSAGEHRSAGRPAAGTVETQVPDATAVKTGWANRSVPAVKTRLHLGLVPRRRPGLGSDPACFRRPRSGTQAAVKVVPALLGALVAVTLAWAACLRHGSPGDLDTFLRAGAAVAHGRNPFPRPGDGQLRRGDAFVYPWAVAFLFVPWTLLPHAVAITAVRLAAVTSLVAAVKLSDLPVRLVGLLLVASPVLVALQVGSLEPFLVLGLVAAWKWRTRWWAGVLLGLATATKLFLLPLLAWPWAAGRSRLGTTATLTAGLVIGSGLVAGPLGLVGEVRLLGELARRESARGWSGAALLYGVGVPDAQLVGLACGIGLTLAGCALVWRRRAPEPLAYSAGIVGSLVATPISWSHYLVMAIALLPVLTAGGVGGAAAVAIGAGSWFLVTPHHTPDALGVVIVGPAMIGLLLARPSPWSESPRSEPDRSEPDEIVDVDRRGRGDMESVLAVLTPRRCASRSPGQEFATTHGQTGRSFEWWWATSIAVTVVVGAIGWTVTGPSRLISPWVALGGLVWALVWVATPDPASGEARRSRLHASSLKCSSHAPEES